MPESLRLATRGSELARKQAQSVADELESRRYDVECVEVETTGDRVRDELIHELGTTGAFVRTLDERVLAGDVNAAVHSLKDMPTEMPDELIVAAVPQREHPGDVLVTPGGTSLEELPDGARIGTASLRRGAQLRAVRPDLKVEPIRGNVDTRLEKLLAPTLLRRKAAVEAAESSDKTGEQALADWLDDRTTLERNALARDVDEEFDGVVLAAAGLERLGLIDDVAAERLPMDRFVPAPGQGALAVTMCHTDLADRVQRYFDDPPTRVEVTVERSILKRLGGGCIAPIGVSATLQGDVVHTRVQVLSQDGQDIVSGTRELPVDRHPTAAVSFAEKLADDGAIALIENAEGSTSTTSGMRTKES